MTKQLEGRKVKVVNEGGGRDFGVLKTGLLTKKLEWGGLMGLKGDGEGSGGLLGVQDLAWS